jgi:regulator of sigma E protease
MAYLLAAGGFALLIILHEFGHFAVAKLVGMRVERFSLFFGPMFAKVRRGETEYGIGVIPLGGYVKITGMNPEEDIPPEVAKRAYYAQPVWKRVVVILAGPAMNLLIAFLILFFLAFDAREPTSSVAATEPKSPAAATLQPGDRIVAVDGRRGDQDVIRDAINAHRCPGKQVDGCRAATPAVVLVERDGNLVRIRVRPRYDEQAKRMLLGFQFDSRPINPGPLEAARISGDLMWFITHKTVEVIVQIFRPEQREQVSSVVGGYEVTRQGFSEDARRGLTILAVVSLSLALINLFPFLPLDGGHVFFSLLEKFRGRPVPFSVMERASALGFVMVVLLFLIGLSNDIDRLSGGGFSNR